MFGNTADIAAEPPQALEAAATRRGWSLGRQLGALNDKLKSLAGAAGDSANLLELSDEFKRLADQISEVRETIEKAARGGLRHAAPAKPTAGRGIPRSTIADRNTVREHLVRRMERRRRRKVLTGAFSMEIIREIGRPRARKIGFGDPAAYRVAERLLSDGCAVPEVARKVSLPVNEVDRVNNEIIAEIQAEIERELAEERRREVEQQPPEHVQLELSHALEASREAQEAVNQLASFAPITLRAPELEQMIFSRRQCVV